MLILLATATSCGKKYNTDYTPPPDGATEADIFPAEISGEKAKLSYPDYGGAEASYGQDMLIYCARLKDKDEAAGFFNKYIAPKINSMKNYISGTFNGNTYGSGSDGDKQAYGWVNENYVFMVRANNDEAMKAIIENFKYISDE